MTYSTHMRVMTDNEYNIPRELGETTINNEF